MDQLWPTRDVTDLNSAELTRLYDFPKKLDKPWVKVNFVSSIDGAATINDRSAALSNPDDQRIFQLGRDLADVVLVGAGTAATEHYRGIKRAELSASERESRDLAVVPPIAVVSQSGSIDPASPLLTDTEVAPLVFTTLSAPGQRREELTAAGADVVVVGRSESDLIDLSAVLAELDRRGLRRVCCEGGPQLFGSLIAANLVDELCWSVSPQLVAGNARRIATTASPAEPVNMRLASTLHADNLLMLRYLRR